MTPGTQDATVQRFIRMTARFLFSLVCAAFVTLTSLRAEIHVDDSVMVAALKDYAEFAGERPQANKSKVKASPVILAVSDFLGLNKQIAASDPGKAEE